MHEHSMTMVAVGCLATVLAVGCGSDSSGHSTRAEGGAAGAPEGSAGSSVGAGGDPVSAAGGSRAGSAGVDTGIGGGAAGAGGSAGDEGRSGAGGVHEDPESVAIAGDWMDDSGTAHVIDNESWVQTASWGTNVFHITQVNNAQEFLIAQNDADNGFNPDLWSRFDWTTWNGSVWYCQTTYDAASEQDAFSAPRADDSDPENGGCGSFAWSQLLDPDDVAAGGNGGAGGAAGTAGDGGTAGTAAAGAPAQGGAGGGAGQAAGGASNAGNAGTSGATSTAVAGSAGASGAGGHPSAAGFSGAAGAP